MQKSKHKNCVDVSGVSIYQISQATTATFTDLYFRLTFLFFVHSGSKRVLHPTKGELIGEVGDMMIFPAGSIVTMENRPVLNSDYRAVGISFADELVSAVFTGQRTNTPPDSIEIIRAAPM